MKKTLLILFIIGSFLLPIHSQDISFDELASQMGLGIEVEESYNEIIIDDYDDINFNDYNYRVAYVLSIVSFYLKINDIEIDKDVIYVINDYEYEFDYEWINIYTHAKSRVAAEMLDNFLDEGMIQQQEAMTPKFLPPLPKGQR